jgi:hypothetical protein
MKAVLLFSFCLLSGMTCYPETVQDVGLNETSEEQNTELNVKWKNVSVCVTIHQGSKVVIQSHVLDDGIRNKVEKRIVPSWTINNINVLFEKDYLAIEFSDAVWVHIYEDGQIIEPEPEVPLD